MNEERKEHFPFVIFHLLILKSWKRKRQIKRKDTKTQSRKENLTLKGYGSGLCALLCASRRLRISSNRSLSC